jgi:DNA-binding transcriptional regulator YiaG
MSYSTPDLVRVRDLCQTGRAKAIRLAAQVSLDEMATDVGVTPGAVHRWESGSRRPHGEAALRYLEVLRRLGEAVSEREGDDAA